MNQSDKRKRYIKIALIVISVVLVVFMVVLDNKRRPSLNTDYVYAKVGKEIIKAFEVDGEKYIFLPGYADKEKIKLSNAAQKEDVRIMQSKNLATIFIETESGTLDNIYEDKDHKESGKIRVVDKEGNSDYKGGLRYIKGRGNYSWNEWEKKSFKLKLKSDASILGLPAGEDYSVIANASDATLIRNDIVRAMEEACHLPFAHRGVFADLYINGEYMGNYYLLDNIGISEEKINVSSLEDEMDRIYKKSGYENFSIYETPEYKSRNLPYNPDDLTGGFLVEREFKERYMLEYPDYEGAFVTDKDEYFVVKSPQYCSKEEIWYLRDYFNELEDKIFAEGDEYLDYIDTDTFAVKYLVQEVAKNYDAGVSSEFFYKDSDLKDSKLKCAPGWDYDMSLGNYLSWMEYYDDVPQGETYLNVASSHSDWWKALYEKDMINTKVRSVFKQDLKPFMDELVKSGVDEYEEMLSSSAEMDAVRWKKMYDRVGYTCVNHTEYTVLKEFIRLRTEYFDGIWK